MTFRLLFDSVVEEYTRFVRVAGEHCGERDGVANGALVAEADNAAPRLSRTALADALHVHPTGRQARCVEQQALHQPVDQAIVKLLWDLRVGEPRCFSLTKLIMYSYCTSEIQLLELVYKYI